MQYKLFCATVLAKHLFIVLPFLLAFYCVGLNSPLSCTYTHTVGVFHKQESALSVQSGFRFGFFGLARFVKCNFP